MAHGRRLKPRRDRPIDLRSDTVTQPTAAMRKAMAEAEVGDDVFREDPTVRRLEEMAAERLGKEGALFVPTGMMGNQIAVNVWTRPGQEVILDDLCHIFNYELGMMAAFSGVLPRPIAGEGGCLNAAAVRQAIRPQVYYVAETGLVTLENTQNMAGGTIYSQPEAEEICRMARDRQIPTHLDGARIFNAAVAVGRPAAELARPFDSVMTCLSKGLGAPIGSILAGPQSFMEEALRVRKRLGGGMRQAGIVAAAGIVALQDQVERLADDHETARRLAERVAAIEGLEVDLGQVQTNIVIFQVHASGLTASRLVERWRSSGVLALAIGDRQVRTVTHYDVDRSDVEAACDRLESIVGGESKGADP